MSFYRKPHLELSQLDFEASEYCDEIECKLSNIELL
jgi:hypothetical protein